MLEDDGEGAGFGVAFGEARVGVRHVQADDEDGEDVEDDDAPEDVADDAREVAGGIPRFAGCDGDGFGCAAVQRKGLVSVLICGMDARGLTYYANEAVTKTEAKPPMPPTNGASPCMKYFPPMYSFSGLAPQLTAMPTMMKIYIPS